MLVLTWFQEFEKGDLVKFQPDNVKFELNIKFELDYLSTGRSEPENSRFKLNIAEFKPDFSSYNLTVLSLNLTACRLASLRTWQSQIQI